MTRDYGVELTGEEYDRMIAEINKVAQLEAVSAKLAEACQKIGEMGMYTIGPSNAHRIIYEMARLAQVALAEYQKLTKGTDDEAR